MKITGSIGDKSRLAWSRWCTARDSAEIARLDFEKKKDKEKLAWETFYERYKAYQIHMTEEANKDTNDVPRS